MSNDMASDVTSKSSVTQSTQEDYTEEIIAEDDVKVNNLWVKK